MYTRSYYPETSDKMNIPENYDGTAFQGQTEVIEPTLQEVGASPSEQREDESVFSFLGKMPLLSGLFGRDSSPLPFRLKMPSIGTEEILILAAAAFLFFSKDGDKECAIMLLLLLLIN